MSRAVYTRTWARGFHVSATGPARYSRATANSSPRPAATARRKPWTIWFAVAPGVGPEAMSVTEPRSGGSGSAAEIGRASWRERGETAVVAEEVERRRAH